MLTSVIKIEAKFLFFGVFVLVTSDIPKCNHFMFISNFILFVLCTLFCFIITHGVIVPFLFNPKISQSLNNVIFPQYQLCSRVLRET